MSFNEDVDDLEEGEIEENNLFDDRIGLNSDTNESIVSNQKNNSFSPIFKSMLSRRSDSLFGSRDTDLRIGRNPNAFNDCDERLIANNPSVRHMNRNPNCDQKLSFVAQNTRKSNSLMNSRQQTNVSSNENNENGFQSLCSSTSMPFSLSENQISVRIRPQMSPQSKPLLPTPIMPLRPEPIVPFAQICRPNIARFDVSTDAQSVQQTLRGTPLPPQDWLMSADPHPNPQSYVIPLSNRSKPIVIPFIDDSNVSRNESQFAVKSIDSETKRTDDSFDTKVSNFLSEMNSKTIVLGSDEIEEVQMSDCAELSPYDPEQDITYLSSPVSPPFLSPENKTNKTEETMRKSENTVNFHSISEQKSNEKCFESHNRTKSSAQNTSIRSESEERNERLNRLLKSNNSVEKKCRKHRNRPKTQMKKSIQMTPRRRFQSSGPMSPIQSTAPKVLVHSKSCKRGHRSRRKVKQMAKRQVLTQISEQRVRNLRPKSRTEMNETSYEDLLEEYKRIQRQLKELENEEKSEVIVERDSDREERENIERLVKSQDMSEISDESKAEVIISDDDDDEHELRRLALESKRKRETEEMDRNEEQRLREHLLQSLFRSKPKPDLKTSEDNNKEVINESNNEVLIQSVEQNSRPESVAEIHIEVDSPVSAIKETDSNSKTEPLPPKPIPKLIINFGDDSTDEEQDVAKNSNETHMSNVPLGLDSFLRQARLRSEPTTNKVHSLPVLSVTKQRELRELKAEIARREEQQINDKKLKQNEIQWKSAKERLEERVSKQNLLKNRVIIKRNALRKAQVYARKMQEAFIAATRVVSATASEFHSFNDELKNIEKDVTKETQNVGKYEKECIRIGLKLKGNTYKLPVERSLKRTNSLTTTPSPNKKRSKSESIPLSKEEMANEKKRLQKELLQKLENCSKLLGLKKAHLLRPSSPLISGLKSPQNSGTTNEITKDSQKCLQTLAKDLLNNSPKVLLISFDCFVGNMFSKQFTKPFDTNVCIIPENESTVSVNYNTNSCYESYDSVLSHLHSYRLIENQPKPISSDHWTNDMNPNQEICRFDLLGTCNDDKCLGQHIDKCLLNPYNKIVDLLLYEPKVASISSEIPERMDSELREAIKQRLFVFAQKLIDSNPTVPLETHCRHIAEQIRKQSSEQVVCLLTRRIPKLFNKSDRMEIPFDDLMYRFSIKDKTLVINQTKISELKLSADPDIYFKNRFYAPEGVPISAQLETTLATDPNNIQLWIKLAYYHISRCSDHNFADSIDRALNVMSRALEHNKYEPELYEHYLFIYSNRVVRKGEEKKFDLLNICRKVVEHCPHYRIWKCFLSLSTDFNQKLVLSNEVINNLVNKSMVGSDDWETRSHQILEMFLYKIELNLQQNDRKIAVLEFTKAVDNSYEDLTNEVKMDFIGDALVDSDRGFAWLCFTYLLINHNLPNHCFEPTKQGFPELMRKNAFIFDWNSLKDKINYNYIKEHLIRAAEHCCVGTDSTQSDNQNCFAIHLNLAELCFVNESDLKYYENLIKVTENDSLLWPLIAEHKLKPNPNHNYSQLIETLKQSPIYMNRDLRIHLKVAKHYFKTEDIISARNELFLIVCNYYNYNTTENLLEQMFETLLFEDEENNHNFELINGRKSKESNSPLLWLSYTLLLEIDSNSVQRIDSAFQTALALCSTDKTDSKDLRLLWSNYLEFSAKNISNEKQFLDLFESVRHCCLTITDPTFQSQVIKFFCEMLSNNEKSKALIQFAKLIPENLSITLSAISFGLKNNRKEMVWDFINSIVFDRKIRLKSLQFWKIAIGLALERSDHLSVHKFFQMAISLLPYNSNLWQNFKTYETNIKHFQHLKQAKDFSHNLNISQF